ncbi:hypothetical protein L195_g052007 [Trifolium pratense]|uniref:Uncharacterized protein n=1 Tax=Trifolium pratense TaxID=57577 RepID=A0A2K3K2R1_TRIPR|nr:hypothetical protein L195_g052007 [Trifolium pratense]
MDDENSTSYSEEDDVKVNDAEDHVHEEQYHRGGRLLNVDVCKEMIDTYVENFDSLPIEEEPTINEETSKLEQKEDQNVSKSDD